MATLQHTELAKFGADNLRRELDRAFVEKTDALVHALQTPTPDEETTQAIADITLIGMALHDIDAPGDSTPNPFFPPWVTTVRTHLNQYAASHPTQSEVLHETVFFSSQPAHLRSLNRLVSGNVEPADDYTPQEFAGGVLAGNVVVKF